MTTISLRQLMADVFECSVDDIDADAKVNETVGWDSLSHINLMLELGQKGIEVAPLQIPDLTTFAAIRRHIEHAGITVDD